MSEILMQIIDESIKLELNVAELYKLFASRFPEDLTFWRELAGEEEHHANLIDNGKKVLLSWAEFPAEILSPSPDELIEVNNRIRDLIHNFQSDPPSRKEAFDLAISLEESAGELHYQRAMTQTSDSEYVKLWQDLNADDKDHAKRLRAYMESNGI